MTKADIIALLEHIQTGVRTGEKSFIIDAELAKLMQQLEADIRVESQSAEGSCDVTSEVNFKHLMQQLQGMTAVEADIRHLLQFMDGRIKKLECSIVGVDVTAYAMLDELKKQTLYSAECLVMNKETHDYAKRMWEKSVEVLP